jgi:hypothetical protein
MCAANGAQKQARFIGADTPRRATQKVRQIMNEMTVFGNTPVTMSSREIAQITGKRHDHTLRDIRTMLVGLYGEPEVSEGMPEKDAVEAFCNQMGLGKGSPKMGNETIQGVSVARDERGLIAEICLDYSHTMTLVSGYSVKLRKAIVDRWQTLEVTAQEAPPKRIPKDNKAIDALRLARAAEINMKTAERIFAHLPNLGGNSKQTVLAHMINPIIGTEVIALPKVTEHLHLAGEVGTILGVSGNMVGRIANELNLKTDEYGEYRLNKAASNDRQVESFYYNSRGIEAVRDALRDRGGVA